VSVGTWSLLIFVFFTPQHDAAPEKNNAQRTKNSDGNELGAQDGAEVRTNCTIAAKTIK